MSQILREGLVRYRARSFVREGVDALGPTIEDVELDTTRESPRQPRIQRVVVGIHIRRRNVHCKREEVCRNHWLDQPLVNEPNQLVTRAALVTDVGHEFKRQFVLHLEGVAVDVRYRRVGQRTVNFNLAVGWRAGVRIDADREGWIRRETEGRIARVVPGWRRGGIGTSDSRRQ